MVTGHLRPCCSRSSRASYILAPCSEGSGASEASEWEDDDDEEEEEDFFFFFFFFLTFFFFVLGLALVFFALAFSPPS